MIAIYIELNVSKIQLGLFIHCAVSLLHVRWMTAAPLLESVERGTLARIHDSFGSDFWVAGSVKHDDENDSLY